MTGKRNKAGLGAAVGGALGLALGAWLGDILGGVLGGAMLGGLIGLVVQNGGRSPQTEQGRMTAHGAFPHHIGPHHLGLGAAGLAAAHHALPQEPAAEATCAVDAGSSDFSAGADCGPSDSGGGGGGDY